MRIIILFILTALVLWGCTSDSDPDQEFSVKGKLVENCQTGIPLSNVNLVLVCKDIWLKKADVVIPFKTNADGSFSVKGERNYSFYYIRYGSYGDLSGLTILDGMGPKHYDVGTIISDFKHEEYYPVILKYDLTGSMFRNGDTIIFETLLNKFANPIKTRIEDFYKSDTVFNKGWTINTNFPDGEYHSYAKLESGSPLNLPNFSYAFEFISSGGVKRLVSKSHYVNYRCDKYPVVTVKVP